VLNKNNGEIREKDMPFITTAMYLATQGDKGALSMPKPEQVEASMTRRGKK
jgi:hypothetical protein